jgi:enoyl-[acyl-carrier protein] reductase I
MQGKRGLIMGVANKNSIAWGIAETWPGMARASPSPIRARRFGKRVGAARRNRSAQTRSCCPATSRTSASVDATFAALGEAWGQLDFLVHAIGFSDKNELKGRYADTTRDNFSRTMVISCFSFTEVAKRAAAMMGPAAR